MEIAMLCQENCISTFVENQQDIRLLINSMTPATVEFFENAFNETRFTKEIKNLQWQVGNPMEVVGQKSQVVTEMIIATALKQDLDQDEETQSRQVVAKMLPLEWVFAKYGGNEKINFKELVIALSESPFDSLFSTELVITLTEHIWSRYYVSVLKKCFLPFCIYFISTQVFLTKYVMEGINTDGDLHQWLIPYILAGLLDLGVLYFLFFEVIVAIRSGAKYFSDPFNYVDIGSFTLNIYLGITTFNHKYEEEVSDNVRVICSAAIILNWFKVFYWLRLFDATSFYVKLITETLSDIVNFLVLFIVILLTFANALVVADHGREKEIVGAAFGAKFIDATLD